MVLGIGAGVGLLVSFAQHFLAKPLAEKIGMGINAAGTMHYRRKQDEINQELRTRIETVEQEIVKTQAAVHGLTHDQQHVRFEIARKDLGSLVQHISNHTWIARPAMRIGSASVVREFKRLQDAFQIGTLSISSRLAQLQK